MASVGVDGRLVNPERNRESFCGSSNSRSSHSSCLTLPLLQIYLRQWPGLSTVFSAVRSPPRQPWCAWTLSLGNKNMISLKLLYDRAAGQRGYTLIFFFFPSLKTRQLVSRRPGGRNIGTPSVGGRPRLAHYKKKTNEYGDDNKNIFFF